MSTTYLPDPVIVGPAIQKSARFISWLFHPLMVGLYMASYLIYLDPDFFTGISNGAKNQILIIYVINSVFFPIIAVLLCRGLGFIQSIYLRTQKERIILYAITMIFFFWTFYVFKNKQGTPEIMAQMSLGIFISVIFAFIANIFFKISMHTTAAGGLVGLFTVLLYTTTASVNIPLVTGIFLAGLISSARLLASDHQVREIIWGLAAGFIAQAVAAWFFN